ncbi:MAG: ArsR/SmtB family transcription factor [bacterium]
MEDLRRAFNALGNRKRLKILVPLLESGEATVGEIAQKHRIHITSASRHLTRLESTGLLTTRQRAQYVYYSPDTSSKSCAIRTILNLIRNSPRRRIK